MSKPSEMQAAYFCQDCTETGAGEQGDVDKAANRHTATTKHTTLTSTSPHLMGRSGNGVGSPEPSECGHNAGSPCATCATRDAINGLDR